ncbi:hypothetical protein [Bernardetia sp.]|uniref:hypothetical protein n=1 Tax=Bernardetia sp. TaxID=1937974 RepID=UPI0025C2CC91|nr:hypothetical protein [Bernardetia sp.]
MKVIEFDGLKIKEANAYIPPFTLSRGEIVNLVLFGGSHYFKAVEKIVEILDENFSYAQLEKVSHSMTVKSYIKKYVQLDKSIVTFFIDFSNRDKLCVKNLTTYERRVLEILTAFSKSDKILFHLVGISPIEEEKIISTLQQVVKSNHYSAILLNNFESNENRFDKTIKLIKTNT